MSKPKYDPMDRQVVTEVHSLDTDFFEGELSDVITKLAAFADRHLNAERVWLEREWDYDSSYNYVVHIDRPETDAEYESRLKELERQRAYREKAKLRAAAEASKQVTAATELLKKQPAAVRRALAEALTKDF